MRRGAPLPRKPLVEAAKRVSAWKPREPLTPVTHATVTADRIARNDATFRQANERVKEAAESFGAMEYVPFFCECADVACRETISLSLEEYETVRENPRRFINVPGHQAAARGTAVVVERHDRFVVVEKHGEAGETSEELDPRS